MRSLPGTLAFLAVSCDPTAPTVRTPIQVVEVVPLPSHGVAGSPAPAAERIAPPPVAARFPEPCRASPFEPESAETTTMLDLPFGSLGVRVVHRAHSDDDICLATLTDSRGSVTDCKTFGDEGCDMERPVASAGRVTVEGVCITEYCGLTSQRAQRIFEVVAASASGIEVRAVTGEVVEECAEE